MPRLQAAVLALVLLASPLFGETVLAAISEGPTSSQSPAPACTDTYDDVTSQFTAAGHPIFEIPAANLPELLSAVESATGNKYERITRAFEVVNGGRMLLGLEQDGCLLPPIVVNANSAGA